MNEEEKAKILFLLENGYRTTIRCHSINVANMREWMQDRGLIPLISSTLVGSDTNCHSAYFPEKEQAEAFSQAFVHLDQDCFCHQRGKVYKRG